MDSTETDWTRLLPDADYRFQFGVSPCDAAEFFAPTAESAKILAERGAWLDADANQYAGLQPDGDDVLLEAVELATGWRSIPNEVGRGHSGFELCMALGRHWEPDFVLLLPDGQNEFRMVGGCVCFPSSWRLNDKLGQPLEAIHGPVPGLNQSLGKPINEFLRRLKHGQSQGRSNWGLSRSPELNQHPDRALPLLAPPVELTDVFLRIERQILIALPRTGGVLFGIRLEIVNLSDLSRNSDAARGLTRALRTMPEDVAAYKNLTSVRDHLASQLEAQNN